MCQYIEISALKYCNYVSSSTWSRDFYKAEKVVSFTAAIWQLHKHQILTEQDYLLNFFIICRFQTHKIDTLGNMTTEIIRAIPG